MTKLSELDFWCDFSYRLLEKEMHTSQAYDSHNQLFVLLFSPFALYLPPLTDGSCVEAFRFT